MARRGASQRLAALLGSGAGMLTSCATRPAGSGSQGVRAASGGGGEDGSQVTRLREDLARLEAREYAEEGIPMFLACDNLADAGPRRSGANAPLPANAALAAEFGRYVVLVPEFRPFASEHDVAKLVAWFFVITGFINAPVPGQLAFAEQHDITPVPDEYPDGRIALSWEELRALDGRHVIASHARSHTRLSSLDSAAMEGEVIGSQRDLVQGLGHPVRTFVSYAGPAYGEFAPADGLVDRAGYQFVFSNYRIQRLRD